MRLPAGLMGSEQVGPAPGGRAFTFLPVRCTEPAMNTFHWNLVVSVGLILVGAEHARTGFPIRMRGGFLLPEWACWPILAVGICFLALTARNFLHYRQEKKESLTPEKLARGHVKNTVWNWFWSLAISISLIALGAGFALGGRSITGFLPPKANWLISVAGAYFLISTVRNFLRREKGK